MSLTGLRDGLADGPRAAGGGRARAKVTVASLAGWKRARRPITAVTAYDMPTGRLLDEAGVDVVLVGDSVGNAVLGYDDTLPVTMEEMLHHVRAVRRGVTAALVVADMPFGSYQVSAEEAVGNAIRFVKEAGAEAVKLEGGVSRAGLVERITGAEVPVVGHIGLTPQSVHRMGGYRVQGRSAAAMEALYADAAALAGAGAVALVVEGVPREVGARITAMVGIPTIGIGAGPECDGQILVFHDMFGLTFGPAAKFVRRYGDAAAMFREGITRYCEDVREGRFPSDAESYHLPAGVSAAGEGEDAVADLLKA